MSKSFNSNSPRAFWHLAKNISNNFTSSSFPPLFHPDGTTAIYSVSKAELFSQTFAHNSTLDDSGLVPPCLPPSDYFMLTIKVLRNDVFHVLSDLYPRKTYGPDGVPPIVLKNCASVLAPCLSSHSLTLPRWPARHSSLMPVTTRMHMPTTGRYSTRSAMTNPTRKNRMCSEERKCNKLTLNTTLSRKEAGLSTFMNLGTVEPMTIQRATSRPTPVTISTTWRHTIRRTTPSVANM
ncbi:hypothetical protein E2C01_023852 [Portunus trituberculatus]|uniref:Uncharacterized protein n=1 Tax=Portunus trituberculatus TaxID=210409 RepID=A0A5B7ECS1_PORTR|nr:hypothetical protein [Portunus trituberculatus]